MSDIRRYIVPNHCYFVTTTTANRRPVFGSRQLAQILVATLGFYRQAMGFSIYGYVIMPDHLHLLITPREGTTISQIMRNFKSHTSKQIREACGKRGAVWQRRFYDRVIRTRQDFLAAMTYIHGNPVGAGFVKSAGEYEFSSYHTYHSGGAVLLEMDVAEL